MGPFYNSESLAESHPAVLLLRNSEAVSVNVQLKTFSSALLKILPIFKNCCSLYHGREEVHTHGRISEQKGTSHLVTWKIVNLSGQQNRQKKKN